MVHGSHNIDLLEVVSWAQNFLSEYQSVTRGRRWLRLQGEVRILVGKPPDHEYCKINCDAAVDNVGGFISIGSVIRDSTGFVMASCSQEICAGFSARVAEAMVIQFAKDCGLLPCVLESDVAVVVKWVNEGNHLDSVWVDWLTKQPMG
ncbi:hypothetical protein Dsin_026490 [Dipteronia sinensis]|uniref:RNase H type-1 domain-containing protein n=1 Tax=Dipteronia sinensis TaxID=43782 RepID=A0AAE0DXV8_9ROSI|nr:hypothetical protein Dsin_026490 [Dipteronia sinensis]